MIRKTAAWIFILLANLVLVAHAVVPHHHHGDITCFGHCSCMHAHSPQQNESDCCGHNGHSSECFLLKQLAPAPNNSFRHECKCQDVPGSHNHSFEAATLPTEIFITRSCFLPAGKISRTPYLYKPYSAFTIRNTGLRAPPVV